MIVLLEDTDNDDGAWTSARCSPTASISRAASCHGAMACSSSARRMCCYLRDTDSDNVADTREVLLTGFSHRRLHPAALEPPHPRDVDGWIYFTNGLSGGDVRRPSDPPEAAVKMGNMDLRWNPWDGRIETTTGQAQYGQAFDEFGNRFICSNRKHIEQVMLQPGDLARNPFLPQTTLTADIPDHGAAAKIFPISSNVTTAYSHGGTFTAACGLVVYRGNAMPECHGNAFVCDPTGNLVHRDILEYTGAACTARHPYGDREFLASTDNWFRPVFLANAPDGALYLCDMYRKTIEHPVYLPPEVAAKTDFTSGRDRGRIYRIVGKDAPRRTAHSDVLGKQDLDSRFHALGNENDWVRETAFRLLYEEVFTHWATQARRLLSSTSGIHRAYCLRLLGTAQIQINPEEFTAAANDADPHTRMAAIDVARGANTDSATFYALLNDPAPMIRARYAREMTAVLRSGPIDNSAGVTFQNAACEHVAHYALANLHDLWALSSVFNGVMWESSVAPKFALSMLTRFVTMADPNDGVHLKIAELCGRMFLPRTAPYDYSPMGPRRDVVDLILNDAHVSLQPWHAAVMLGLLEIGRNDSLEFDRYLKIEHKFLKGKNWESLEEFSVGVGRFALNSELALPVRMVALRLLGSMKYDNVIKDLREVLHTTTHGELLLAAANTLIKLGVQDVGVQLTKPATWNAYSAGVRDLLKSILFSDDAALKQLLTGIKNGELSPFTIDPVSRNLLMKRSDPAIATLAQEVFANISSENRAKVYEDQKDLLQLPPDATHGRAVYAEQCAQCHVFKGEGHKVGPELSDMSLQTPDYILLHLIDPNKAVTAGFESYTVNTTGLDTHKGILAAQNDTAITLRQALGTEQTIPRAEIATLTTENRSLMPEELEKVLSKQQIRDLIGFLRGE
jgi:putative membrane-bound dehydrogenase-like protein